MASGRDWQETYDQKEPRNPKPYALALLWAVIMAPITLLLGAVQPFTNIPFQVLPLVMVGPFVAAALCKLIVPSWFPSDAPRATTALTKKAWIATALSSLVYVLTLVLLATSGYTPFVVHDWPKPIAVAAVCIGFIFGSWCEEVGFRGIMYRALAAKLGPWPSVVINGVFFGLCHLQYFDVGVLPVHSKSAIYYPQSSHGSRLILPRYNQFSVRGFCGTVGTVGIPYLLRRIDAADHGPNLT